MGDTRAPNGLSRGCGGAGIEAVADRSSGPSRGALDTDPGASVAPAARRPGRPAMPAYRDIHGLRPVLQQAERLATACERNVRAPGEKRNTAVDSLAGRLVLIKRTAIVLTPAPSRRYS